jgi:hypothetical protein
MFTRLVILACAVSLGACSTYTPRAQSEQYCDLKTETVSVKKNGQVMGEETVEVMRCNDNKVDRLFHAQSGMATNCGEYKYYITLRNKPVERRGYACKKYDGTYEVVPHPSMFQ